MIEETEDNEIVEQAEKDPKLKKMFDKMKEEIGKDDEE